MSLINFHHLAKSITEKEIKIKLISTKDVHEVLSHSGSPGGSTVYSGKDLRGQTLSVDNDHLPNAQFRCSLTDLSQDNIKTSCYS